MKVYNEGRDTLIIKRVGPYDDMKWAEEVFVWVGPGQGIELDLLNLKPRKEKRRMAKPVKKPKKATKTKKK